MQSAPPGMQHTPPSAGSTPHRRGSPLPALRLRRPRSQRRRAPLPGHWHHAATILGPSFLQDPLYCHGFGRGFGRGEADVEEASYTGEAPISPPCSGMGWAWERTALPAEL